MLKKLPNIRQGATVSISTPSGTAHITMNHDDLGEPFEVFVEIGKAGSSIKAMAEAIGRLISLILRLEPIRTKEKAALIVEQLSLIGGAHSVGFGKDKVLSLPDAISKAMAEHYELLDVRANNLSAPAYAAHADKSQPRPAGKEQKANDLEHDACLKERGPAQTPGSASHAQRSLSNADICPICGQSSYIRQEGCTLCLSCGYSEC